MEDQQPDAGALSDNTPANPSGDAAPTETDSAKTEFGQPNEDAAEQATATDGAASAEEPIAESGGDRPARRPAGKWLAVAVGIAAAVFVGSAAFAGAAVQPYLVDRAAVSTKMQVARTAANAITTLWTYNPDNIEKLPDRAAQYLGGDFGAEYRKYIDKIIAPSKQAQITNSTDVTGAAVESLNGSNAVALVYTNTTSTTPLTQNMPALKYFSYRLTMKREHARWLVTKMSTVTSLDLTPQL